MNIRRLAVDFVTMFAVALVTGAVVTFLWNFTGHQEGTVDWETTFTFAVMFGIVLTWAQSRAIGGKPASQPTRIAESRKR